MHTQEIVLTYLKALAARDLNAIMPLFSEKVDWDVPGNETLAPWLGKRETAEEVKEFYHLLWKNTEAIDANIDHLFIDGSHAVVTGTFSSKMLQTGAVYTSLFFIHLTVENDLIVRYRLLEDSYGVVKALSV
jgi:uncharacterized protein